MVPPVVVLGNLGFGSKISPIVCRGVTQNNIQQKNHAQYHCAILLVQFDWINGVVEEITCRLTLRRKITRSGYAERTKVYILASISPIYMKIIALCRGLTRSSKSKSLYLRYYQSNVHGTNDTKRKTWHTLSIKRKSRAVLMTMDLSLHISQYWPDLQFFSCKS